MLVGLAHGHLLMGQAHEHLLMGLAHEHLFMGLAHEHMLRSPSQEAEKRNWRWRVTKPILVRSANTSFPPNPICSGVRPRRPENEIGVGA